MFQQIDTNNNGSLEKEEVREFFVSLTNMNGGVFSEEKFARNFEKMDKNSDFKVDMEELYKFM